MEESIEGLNSLVKTIGSMEIGFGLIAFLALVCVVGFLLLGKRFLHTVTSMSTEASHERTKSVETTNEFLRQSSAFMAAIQSFNKTVTDLSEGLHALDATQKTNATTLVEAYRQLWDKHAAASTEIVTLLQRAERPIQETNKTVGEVNAGVLHVKESMTIAIQSFSTEISTIRTENEARFETLKHILNDLKTLLTRIVADIGNVIDNMEAVNDAEKANNLSEKEVAEKMGDTL